MLTICFTRNVFHENTPVIIYTITFNSAKSVWSRHSDSTISKFLHSLIRFAHNEYLVSRLFFRTNHLYTDFFIYLVISGERTFIHKFQVGTTKSFNAHDIYTPSYVRIQWIVDFIYNVI